MEPDFLQSYLHYVKTIMDDKGINPFPAMFKTFENKIRVFAFAIPPEEVLMRVLAIASKGDIKEFCFGLDRYNAPGQGVDMRYKSLFTAVHFPPADQKMQVVVMPYNGPGQIGDLQYNNLYWQQIVSREVKGEGSILADELRQQANRQR